jgi:hypothetical protein
VNPHPDLPSVSKPGIHIRKCDGWATITCCGPEYMVQIRKEFGAPTSRNAARGTWTWALPADEVEFGPTPKKRGKRKGPGS